MTVVGGVSVLPVPPQITTSQYAKTGPWIEPDIARRSGAAWKHGAAPLLRYGEPVDRAVLIAAMVAVVVPLELDSEVLVPIIGSTANSIIQRAWHYGVLQREDDHFQVTEFGRWCRPELRL